MNKQTKSRIHNITAKAALKFVSEAWVLKKREEQLRIRSRADEIFETLTWNNKTEFVEPAPPPNKKKKFLVTPLADTHYKSSSSSYSKCAHIIFHSRGGVLK